MLLARAKRFACKVVGRTTELHPSSDWGSFAFDREKRMSPRPGYFKGWFLPVFPLSSKHRLCWPGTWEHLRNPGSLDFEPYPSGNFWQGPGSVPHLQTPPRLASSAQRFELHLPLRTGPLTTTSRTRGSSCLKRIDHLTTFGFPYPFFSDPKR